MDNYKETTLFKKPYTRFSKFSMETLSISPIQKNTKLKLVESPLHLTFNIGRDGDLINQINLQLTIPDIYSFDSTIPGGNSTDKATQFRWISRLG